MVEDCDQKLVISPNAIRHMFDIQTHVSHWSEVLGDSYKCGFWFWRFGIYLLTDVTTLHILGNDGQHILPVVLLSDGFIHDTHLGMSSHDLIMVLMENHWNKGLWHTKNQLGFQFLSLIPPESKEDTLGHHIVLCFCLESSLCMTHIWGEAFGDIFVYVTKLRALWVGRNEFFHSKRNLIPMQDSLFQKVQNFVNILLLGKVGCQNFISSDIFQKGYGLSVLNLRRDGEIHVCQFMVKGFTWSGTCEMYIYLWWEQ